MRVDTISLSIGHTQRDKDLGSLPKGDIKKALGGSKTLDVEDLGDDVSSMHVCEEISAEKTPSWKTKQLLSALKMQG